MKITDLHKQIFDAFKPDHDDKFIAEALEDLLDFLLYNKEKNINKPVNNIAQALDNMYNDEIRKELFKRLSKKFPFISESSTGQDLVGKSSLETGDLFEFLLDDLGKMITEQNSSTEIINLSSVTGQDRRIIEVPEQFAKDFLTRQSRKTYEGSIEDSKHSPSKQMKTDIDWNNLTMGISIEGEFSAEIQKILSSSFSAKNYNSLPVHLEDVIPQQAYAGMVNFLNGSGKYSDTAILNMYKFYLERAGKKGDDAFFKHLHHIIKIQALVGAGQTQVDTKTAVVLGPAILPRFLIINARNQSKVYVRSTRQIIQNIKKMQQQIALANKRISVSYNTKPGEIGELKSY